MHRHPLRRALAATLAVWFALVTSEPVSLHPCPMHDGALAALASEASPAASHAEAQRAGHDEHGPGASGASHGAPEHDAGHSCNCLGHCCAATGAAAPVQPPLAWLAGVVDVEPALDAPPQRLPVAVDHLALPGTP
jgi:hypothetical protein